MTIKLDKPMLDLSGQPISINGKPSPKMCDFVAEILFKGQSAQPLKSHDLALKFYSGVPVEMDDADFRFVRETVEGCNFWAGVRGALLKEMDNQKLVASINTAPPGA